MRIPCAAAVLVLTVLSTQGPVADAQTAAWIEQFGTPRNDMLFAVAPGVGGDFFTCGETFGSLGGPNSSSSTKDAWLARHDGTGARVWVRQLGTNGNDSALGVVSDGSGGVFVAGWTRGNLGGAVGGTSDAWIARYDGQGTELWLRQLGTSAADIAVGIASDGAGGAILGGWTFGSLGGPNLGGSDAWLARFDDLGAVVWIRQFGTSSYDEPESLSSDGSGGVLMTGVTGASLGGPFVGNGDAWIARYDVTGTEVWAAQIGSTRFDLSTAAAPDGAGGAFAVGYTSGSLLQSFFFGGRNAWIGRFDSTGQNVWVRELVTFEDDRASGVAGDGNGGIVVCGGTGGSLGAAAAGPSDGWIASYSGAGSLEWIDQLGTPGSDGANAIAVLASGSILVAGGTTGNLGAPALGEHDVWIASLSDGPDVNRYCTPAVAGSLLLPATMVATGSSEVAANDLQLVATSLPRFSFGYFLLSRTQDFVPNPAGSMGNLCLGGAIGRLTGPGEIQNSGDDTAIELSVDLTAFAQPSAPVAVQPGDVWNFQAWYRDNAQGVATSNFTDAVSVTFR